MTLHRTEEEAEEKIAPNGRRSRRENCTERKKRQMRNCTERKKQKRKLHRTEEETDEKLHRTEDGMRGYIDK